MWFSRATGANLCPQRKWLSDFVKFLVSEEREQERDGGFDMFAFHIHHK